MFRPFDPGADVGPFSVVCRPTSKNPPLQSDQLWPYYLYALITLIPIWFFYLILSFSLTEMF